MILKLFGTDLAQIKIIFKLYLTFACLCDISVIPWEYSVCFILFKIDIKWSIGSCDTNHILECFIYISLLLVMLSDYQSYFLFNIFH